MVTSIISGGFDLDPNLWRFVEQLITMSVILYIMGILYFSMCLNIILGADLDRSLHETRTSWSILDSKFISAISNTLFHSGAGGVKTIEVREIDDAQHKFLMKFETMSEEQLDIELKKLKEQKLELKQLTVSIENLKYNL